MINGPLDTQGSRRWFQLACLFELLLVAAGLGLAKLFRIPFESWFRWSGRDFAWGLAGVVPLVIMLAWIVHTSIPAVRQIPAFLDTVATPILARWSLLQLATLSAVAGLGEELLFRFFLQTWVSQWTGAAVGLLLASLVFGVCHWVSPAYALIAALVGAYLGVLFILTSNLLVPALAHAVYDFVALVYFVRLRTRLVR
jgi:membrane protease YdiL (CAAX protease family)